MARRRTIYNFDLWIQRKAIVSDLTSDMFLLFSLFSFDCSFWLQSCTVFLLSWGVKWSLLQKIPWSMSSLNAYGRLVFYFVIYFSLGKGFLLCIFFKESYFNLKELQAYLLFISSDWWWVHIRKVKSQHLIKIF